MAKEKAPQQDDHAGHGGSYLIDKDGNKTLVARTAPQDEETPRAPALPPRKK